MANEKEKVYGELRCYWCKRHIATGWFPEDLLYVFDSVECALAARDRFMSKWQDLIDRNGIRDVATRKSETRDI